MVYDWRLQRVATESSIVGKFPVLCVFGADFRSNFLPNETRFPPHGLARQEQRDHSKHQRIRSVIERPKQRPKKIGNGWRGARDKVF
jgi:hypothetical protein